MLKKFLSKYFMDVIPSIVATVAGAYIVTHYVNARPDADKPKAAVTAPAEATKGAAPQPVKADDSAARAAAAAKEAARLKAEKLAADKAAAEKAAAEKTAAEKAAAAERAAERIAVERAEAARKAAAEKLATERAAERREKAGAKAASSVRPSAEASAAPEDGRDANDLARAAIERLRSAEPRTVQPQRAPESARAHEQAKEQSQPQERPRVNEVVYAPAPPQAAPQPLPPAVTVAPVPNALAVAPAPFPAPSVLSPPAAVRADDSSRPTPPADIPSQPLDLHARQDRSSVAEDVVSAAKSVFQAVVPDPTN
jgi:hypothetical protein